jgi:MFS family permease
VVEQGLGRSSGFFGVLSAVQGGGAVLGGIASASVIRRLGERNTIAVALGILAVGLAVAAVPNVWVVCGAMAGVGVCVPWLMVAFTTVRQRLTPARLQGRVAAASNMALNGPQTLGIAAGAGLVAVVDYRVLLVGMAVGVAACAIPAAGRTELATTQAIEDAPSTGAD